MSEEITQEEYLALTKAKKPSKHKNIKTTVDGYTFDSAMEARRYEELKLELRAGTITDLVLQPRVIVLDKFYDKLNTKWRKGIIYIPDFSYIRDGVLMYEDVKGQETEAFLIKEKLFRQRYPDIPLIINYMKGR